MTCAAPDQPGPPTGEAATRQPAAWRRWWRPNRYWMAAWVIALVYTCVYAGMIHQYKAAPYFDQTNYVTKTYSLIEQWNAASRWIGRLNPMHYLAAPPTMRPPLMMFLPAAIWRRHATAHDMAYTWLLQRMILLMAGLWVFSRTVRDERWVPAALCVILGGYTFLTLNQNLYLMDLPFASMALLSVALVGWAMQRHSVRAAALAAAGTIALFLVKPQGLVYLFPFMAVLSVERVVYEIRTFRSRGGRSPGRQLGALCAWTVVMAALLGVIYFLFQSDYGVGVRAQYAWGQEGYWATGLSWSMVRLALPGLLPGWMVIALVVAAGAAIMKRRGATCVKPLPAGVGWLVAMFFVALAFWLLFTMVFTYAFDFRIIWSITPLLVCAAMFVLCRRKWFRRAVTVIAGILFLSGVSISAFGFPLRELPNPAMLFGPRVVKQIEAPDGGERALVAGIQSVVRGDQPHGAATQPVIVHVLICQDYLEYAGMNLLARWMNHDDWSMTHYEQFPWGDGGFDIAREFDFSRGPWFLTRTGPAMEILSARSFLNLRAMESLILDPRSPIHGLFEQRLARDVLTPAVDETPLQWQAGEDAMYTNHVTLWHLQRALTPAEFRDSLAFILPRYKDSVGEAAMKTKLAELERTARQGNGLKWVDDGEIAGLSHVAVREVTFDRNLVLRALRFVPLDSAAGGGLRVEMYWQATAQMALRGNRFFHLNNAADKIIGQADGPQDPLHGTARAGTQWIDSVTLTPQQLVHVKTIGIGIQHPDGSLAKIAAAPAPPAALDWNGQRLIVPLPSSSAR